jgi:hypothetical protein
MFVYLYLYVCVCVCACMYTFDARVDPHSPRRSWSGVDVLGGGDARE